MEQYNHIPPYLHQYFWDVDSRNLDLKEQNTFIIARLLNEGDHLALKWVFSTYKQKEILQAVKTNRSLSLKTARCWQNYFGLKEEEMKCFGKFSTTLSWIY